MIIILQPLTNQDVSTRRLNQGLHWPDELSSHRRSTISDTCTGDSDEFQSIQEPVQLTKSLCGVSTVNRRTVIRL